jgi:ankyrin repeat protein
MLFSILFFLSSSHTPLFSRVMNQFYAAGKGDLQQLRVALTVNNLNDDDYDGLTALHCAANSGYADCVKLCIKMGANVNARSIGGLTPLHIPLFEGHANVVRALLDAGAIVDAADDDGWTPLHYAIRDNCVDAARLLIDGGAKVSSVQLDDDLPAIADWVTAFIESRSNCRTVSIIIIGIHKYRLTTVTGNNDVNVLRLISKHIWSSRMNDLWITPPLNRSR